MVQGLTESGLVPLCNGLTRLESLNIAWTGLNRGAVLYLLICLPPTLLKLNLSGCREMLLDEGEGWVATAIWSTFWNTFYWVKTIIFWLKILKFVSSGPISKHGLMYWRLTCAHGSEIGRNWNYAGWKDCIRPNCHIFARFSVPYFAHAVTPYYPQIL